MDVRQAPSHPTREDSVNIRNTLCVTAFTSPTSRTSRTSPTPPTSGASHDPTSLTSRTSYVPNVPDVPHVPDVQRPTAEAPATLYPTLGKLSTMEALKNLLRPFMLANGLSSEPLALDGHDVALPATLLVLKHPAYTSPRQ